MTPLTLTVSQWCWLYVWESEMYGELADVAHRLDITEAQARELLHQIRMEAARE